MNDWEGAGFLVLPACLPAGELPALRREADRLLAGARERGGARHGLQRSSLFAELATRPELVDAVRATAGGEPHAVNLTVFDKTPEANWKVPLHQDHTIPVAERRDVAGFGPWSEKDGVLHVQPPVEVLAALVALRLHLDDTGVHDGALVVVPGSHRLGRLSRDELRARHGEPERVAVAVPAGGALLMSPLLFHASSPAAAPTRRRVLHFEYATRPLPGGLRWA